jgi:hypothetical protein
MVRLIPEHGNRRLKHRAFFDVKAWCALTGFNFPFNLTVEVKLQMANPPLPTSVDEELNQIEKDIRTLKIEFEQYFGGGRKRPPNDTQWRVETMIKRYGERVAELTLVQRFRYNNLASTYAKYQDIWRKKLASREMSNVPQHFGAAAKAIAMARARKNHLDQAAAAESQAAASQREAHRAVRHGAGDAFRVNLSDPGKEIDKVRTLYTQLVEKRLASGETTGGPSLRDFESFVQSKTSDLKSKGAKEVEYSVSVEGGKVKLKARVSK